MKLKTLFLFSIVSCTTLFTACTKESSITQLQPADTSLVHDRGTVKVVTDGRSNDPAATASVAYISINTGTNSIPISTRYDVYAHAPQSSYTEPTSGYQLISQHGSGALVNQSISPSVTNYNTIFSTPNVPDSYYIWFKIEEWNVSGTSPVLVSTRTEAAQPNQ